MNEKEKDLPLYLEKLQALERRLSPNHPRYQTVVESYSRSIAGYKGEKSLDYYLSFLSKDNYTVLHNIRLHNGVYYFQIDYLLITEKYILLIEVKNYAGVLHYDPHFHQLIRTMNGKEVALPDPLSQIERQKFQLLTLLTKRKYPYTPIETLAVISNPLTILKTSNNQEDISRKLIHSGNLARRLKEIDDKYKETRLSSKEIKNLSKYLLKINQSVKLDILEKFNISQQELLTGVQCPACGALPMKRLHGKWLCQICKNKSKNAHQIALRDFSLLINETITNKEAREFLRLDSDATTKRILTSLNIPFTGVTKDRRYYIEM
ncbi:nuclease-related domain-containing protein [Bacillus suaedaesalsae]|uniref:NERD domain-containing protein n=1 Tax=Bacillus suaedaesalsae TaxID=2810349 RepID=A0ABS2DJ08_9BACI|nr:nuclease-related domain-containing protein [Bacillus suaedaesalsae]MBM6617488.1 NERD domain-containing protein [Bacillus suaedaesalsae]